MCAAACFLEAYNLKAWIKKYGIRLAVGIVALILYIGAIWFVGRGKNGYTTSKTDGIEYEVARVLDILEDNSTIDETTDNLRRGDMQLRLELLTGRYQGDIVEVTNYFSAMYNIDVKQGDKVTVRIDTTDENEYQVSIYNYHRTPFLIAMVVLFAAALCAIGGRQGVRAFAGLVFTFVSIIFLLLPLVVNGWPALPFAILLVTVTSTVCFYLLGGWQPKTIAAAAGCLCGILIAALFGAAGAALVHISAYQMDEAEALMLVTSDSGLQMHGIFLSGVLIAAEGAVMDIAMSIASAMDELKKKRPELSAKELFCSGMQVGKDASGTMANTLVLAYAGSSFNMMVLIYSYDVSFTQLMNTDFVAIELVKGIAGSIGILAAVPCVAGIAALLLSRSRNRNE